MTMRRLVLIAGGIGVVLIAAACGGTTTYTTARTKSCLTQRGVRVGGKLDFVATTATGGAFVAHLGENFVTVAFGDNLGTGEAIETAYLRFARPNIRPQIADVLRRYANAVTLWHTHPSDSDLSMIVGCLH
jgi:hypothetical protein